MKSPVVVVLAVAVLLLSGCATSPAITSLSASEPDSVAVSGEVGRTLRAGIEAYDKGDYQQAIARYQQVLAADAGNTIAMYELAMTYMTINENDQCIATARQGMKNAGVLGTKFKAVMGSCYSQSGDFGQALDVFKSALKDNPNDSSIHYNIAVTYAKSGNHAMAIDFLESTIRHNPSYASPYLVLAETYRITQRSSLALFHYLQFAYMEGNTPRGILAAQQAFDSLYAGVGVTREAISINLDTGRGDEYRAMDLAMKLTAASSLTTAYASRAEQQVETLLSLVDIAAEMAANESTLISGFDWEYSVGKLVDLHAAKDLEAFAYLLAEQVGLDGASQWLDNNPARTERFVAAM